MTGHHRLDSAPRVVTGIILTVLGVLFTLDTLGYIDAYDVWRYWPLILIAVGLAKVLQPMGAPGRCFGGVLIFFGILFLLHNLHVIRHSVWELWPLILVIMGLSILLRALSLRRPPGEAAPPPILDDPSAAAGPASSGPVGPVTGYPDVDPTIHAVGILGGCARRIAAQDFRGGDATAIMGACELDFRQASIASGPAQIDAFAMWGGIEMRVPPDWTVVVKGLPLLGGFADNTTSRASDPRKVLIVRGAAIMGGVEVKN